MFNQYTGIGRFSADPESRFTQAGTQVVNFTLCCDSGWGDKKRTEFVRVVAWDKLAKVVADYMHKGSLCMIQGEKKARARSTAMILGMKVRVISLTCVTACRILIVTPTSSPNPSMGEAIRNVRSMALRAIMMAYSGVTRPSPFSGNW